MDTSEATKVVMSRIQSLDPENASKIMGYILIQDQGEKEIIRLAFSPDALLLSYINQAKLGLGLSSSPPLSYPIRPENHFPQNSPRIMIPNNGFHLSTTPSSPIPPFPRSRPRPISYTSSLLDELPFLDDLSGVDPIMSPSGNSDSLVFPYGEDVSTIPSPHPHRRSCSVNDAASFLDEGNGFLWRPCMYFARGFCKNGSSCKFLHSDGGGVEAIDVGSPSNTDELLKLKALRQQRLAFMGGHNPFAYNKCIDSLNENLRNDFSPMGLSGGASSSSRQIYLTFPADSMFKEDDVSNYFSMFGPVQDVRIPYQQKRMFGFVTFVYPETVRLILAKGNPHFVCDSRVLVKPYKEKGKVREKKQQQHHLERGEYSACLSPSGFDSRDHFDHPFGPRMLLSPQEMMLRKKLEQEAELQHAIELQGQRMMSLQLKNQNHNHHYLQTFPYASPRQSQLLTNQNVTTSFHSINKEDSEESDGGQEAGVVADEKLVIEGAESFSDLHESFEHILPDNLFASPTKSAAENQSFFNQASAEADDGISVAITSSNNIPTLPNSSPLTMASLKSCYLQLPRFSSGQEAIEM